MADVVMADDGIAFDGAMAETGPLGGAETAFVALAEALATRGHRVEARSNCRAPLRHNGVAWAPLANGIPDSCDLYIGNRGHRVIGLVPSAGRRVFWLHNPGRYLRKPRFAWPLLRHRPILVTTGDYHSRTVPRWLPCGGRQVIPYGVLDRFRRASEREPAPPIAVFTSNPLRGLDWLLDLWVEKIRPAVPEAELHIYAGPAVYGKAGKRAREMDAVLARADTLAMQGVWRHPPVGRDALIEVLAAARLMIYRGDPGETFCLSVAEAQAMGVPAVVQPIGSLPERVINGATGCVAAGDAAFVDAAATLLQDDELWRRYHRNALASQRGLSWDEVAARFEALI